MKEIDVHVDELTFTIPSLENQHDQVTITKIVPDRKMGV